MREWWIEKFGIHWRSCDPSHLAIHVIEKSAYDELLRKFELFNMSVPSYDELKAEICIQEKRLDGWKNDYAKLKEENERLKGNQLKSFDVAVPSDEWYDTVKERDDLKARLDDITNSRDNYREMIHNHQVGQANLIKERDELKEELVKTKHALEQTNDGRPSEWAYSILRKERDELNAENEKLLEKLATKHVTVMRKNGELELIAESYRAILLKCVNRLDAFKGSWRNTDMEDLIKEAREALEKK